jgi:predicted O-methyltransferase YrrM
VSGPPATPSATLDGPFDFAFIDADKASGAEYYRSCVQLVRPGGVIIVDNVVRAGTILDPGSSDEAVIGTCGWPTRDRRRAGGWTPR